MHNLYATYNAELYMVSPQRNERLGFKCSVEMKHIS